MKYRKKPVVIEAFQYDGDFTYSDGTPYEAPEFIFEALEKEVLYFKDAGNLYAKTLEGKMLVSCGDYIIQGVKGEIYPCKPDIFEATYEVAEQGVEGVYNDEMER